LTGRRFRRDPASGLGDVTFNATDVVTPVLDSPVFSLNDYGSTPAAVRRLVAVRYRYRVEGVRLDSVGRSQAWRGDWRKC
jgi:hypothetical protein